MGTLYRNCCPACGSYDVAAGDLTCVCNNCGWDDETRIFRKQHASKNAGISERSSSVPMLKRTKKRKRDE